VAHLCRPFTVLGARLGALPDTVLLVLDPGMQGVRRHPPVFLAVAGGGDPGAPRWELAATDDPGAEALAALSRAATRERERLVSREVPIRSDPSEALRSAARRAWSALPDAIRAAIEGARTVLYLPSSAGRLDTVPFELLLHEGGWLGTTHVVVRCPSFQYLEAMLAPNGRGTILDDRATVAHAEPDESLGVLAAAEAEIQTALRAAGLLGLQARERRLATPADALDVFAEGALLHYVGHGFADELGEFLPLSGDVAVSASALPDAALAPFVFFNACLVGRVRHLGGGRQRGWAVTLLEHGAPGVVGALYPVPDSACPLIAEAFYRGVWKAPLGEGMRLARERLDRDGVNPLVWAPYVVHGDPNAVISRAVADGPRSSAEITARWPALLTRQLATHPRDGHDAILAELAPELVQADLEAAARGLLESDPEAAAACRILRALQRPVPEELETAYLAAAALGDEYAEAVLAPLVGAPQG
jgi:CHAT domain